MWRRNTPKVVVPMVVALVMASSTVVSGQPTAARADSPTTPMAPPTPVVTSAQQSNFENRSKADDAALASTTAPDGSLSAAAAVDGVVEVPQMRSQFGRTFATPTGQDEAVIGTTALNYRASSGGWQPIDDSLVSDSAAGYAWRNKADHYVAEFPSSLADGPVTVSIGSASVSYRIVGAAGSVGTVNDNVVTYAHALSGVDVVLAATPSGVKETLTLASAASQSSITYDLTASAGVTVASESDGGATFTDSAGNPVASLLPPTVTDASNVDGGANGVLSSISPTTDRHWSLTTQVSQSWLNAADRAFPVFVDPTIEDLSVPAERDCVLESGQPGTSFCSSANGEVGYKNDANKIRRTLAQFSLTTIPSDAVVTNASYNFDYDFIADTTSMKIHFYRNTKPWTSSATWNSSGYASNDWTGGATTTDSSTYDMTVGSSNTGWNTAYLTLLVQGWVDKSTENDGLIVKADSESTAGRYGWYDASASSNASYLYVFFTADTGDDGKKTFLSSPLTDKTNLKIDPADGNLLIDSTDMSVRGTGDGSTLKFAHSYNSDLANFMSANGVYPTSELGAGWLEDNTLDATILSSAPAGGGGSVAVIMPGGVIRVFTKQSGSDAYNAPKDMNAKLTRDNSSNTYTLVDHKSGLNYKWIDGTPAGYTQPVLRSITTAAGETISSDGGSTVTDTKGRQFQLAQTYRQGSDSAAPYYQNNAIVDSSGGRSVHFTFADFSDDDLATQTDAAGNVLQYTYNGAYQITDIQDPSSGQDTSITYYPAGDFRAGYVHTVTRTTTDCSHSTATGYTTTYSYSASIHNGPSGAVGDTSVTDPGGLTTVYYWDHKGHVVETDDAAGNKQANTYDPTSGQLRTFTDNLGTGKTLIDYSGAQVSAVTAPTDGTGHTAAKSTVDSRSTTDSTSSSYQGPASVPTKVTDAQGNHTNYTIPSSGASAGHDLVTKVTQTDSGNNTVATQSLTYNADGTVHTITNANNQTTTYGYDGHANLTSVTPPAPQQPIGYTEDSDNRLASMTDGKNQTTSYTYDNDDRPTTVTYADGSYLQYTYDSDGNLIARRNRDGSTDTISYDGLNRPVGQTVQGEQQSYCYDASNHLTSVTNTGGTVTYKYDGSGFLTAVSEPGSSNCLQYDTLTNLPAPGSRCIAITMDADNHPTVIAFPGYVQRTTTYLNSGKISHIVVKSGSTKIEDQSYSYLNGSTAETQQLRQTTDNLPSSPISTTYSYDGLNRLKTANGVENTVGGTPSTENESWTLDGEGNITKYVVGSTSSYRAYDNNDELCYLGATANPTCSTTGASTYTHDADGNLTSVSNGFAVTYDASNSSSAFTRNQDTGAAGYYPATYSDYGQSQRTGLGSTSFTNSIQGLAASSTGTGGTRVDYTRLPTGETLAMRSGATTGYNPATTTNSYYALVDRQNSVLGTTDDGTGGSQPNAAVTSRYAYNPYGQTLSYSGATAATNRIQWLGTYKDTETGLYHFGARYYSPGLERFMQTDPQSHQLDLVEQNNYSYAGGDPLDQTDPSGYSFLGKIKDFGKRLGDDASNDAIEGAIGGAATGCVADSETGCLPGAVVGAYGGAVGGLAVGTYQAIKD